MIKKNLIIYEKNRDYKMIQLLHNYDMKMLFGNDEVSINGFEKIYNNNINFIMVNKYNTFYYDPDTNESAVGYTLKNDGKLDVYVRGLNFSLSKKNRNKVFSYTVTSHELMHTVTNCLVDTNKNKLNSYKNFYLNDYGFVVLNKNDILTSFSESGNEFMNYVLLNGYLYNDSIDDYMIGSSDSIAENNSLKSTYFAYLPIIKLFSAAFCNNPYHSYDDSIDDSALVFNYTRLYNNKIVNTNDYITWIMSDPLRIIEEFDKFCPNKIEKMLLDMDTLLEKTTDKGTEQINKRFNKDKIINIINNISLFSERKAAYMLGSHGWSESECQEYFDRYNVVLNNACSEYDLKRSKVKVKA